MWQRGLDPAGPIIEIVTDQDGADQATCRIAHRLPGEDRGLRRRRHQVNRGHAAAQHVGQAGPAAEVMALGHGVGHGAMADHSNDLPAGGVDHLDDNVGVNRQRPFQPGLQRRGFIPVLTQARSTGQEAKNRPPVGIPGLDHRLRDEAVVDELGIERSLAAAAQFAGGG